MKAKPPERVFVLYEHASLSVVDVTAISGKHLWARRGETVHEYRLVKPKPKRKARR